MTQPPWQQVLIDCGYPRKAVCLDFETYFDEDQSLSKQSTIEHIAAEEFEILCVSCHEQTQPYTECKPHCWVGEDRVAGHIEHLQREYGSNLEGCTLVAQNAYYEAAILARRFDITPPFVIDTIGLHRHLNARASHKLVDLAAEAGLPAKGKTSRFKGVTNRTRRAKPKGRGKAKRIPKLRPRLKGEILTQLIEYCNHDVWLTWQLLCRYMPRLTNTAFELRVMQHTIDIWTKPRLAVDYAFGDELTRQMEAKIEGLVSLTGLAREEISGNHTFEKHLVAAMAEVGETPPYKQGKVCNANPSGMNLAIAKDDPELELLLTHKHEPVRNLIHARVGMKSWPNHIGRVHGIVNQCKAAGDRLCVPLKYHGAHTGRWSGAEDINLQNLPSRNPEQVINDIRKLLVAPPGHVLPIADASQIEARVLAWEASQIDLLQRFENGEEIYATFASRVLGTHVRKPRKTDPPPVKAKHAWGRNAVGKTGVLGCGYGMGPSKVIDYTKGAVDVPTAERIVKLYRQENDQIVQYWTDLEDAFAISVRYQKETAVGHLRIFPDPDQEDVTVIELPTKRWLRYYKPRVKGIGFKRSIKIWNARMKSFEHIWGGHLTENVIQAMSRDILAEAMLGLEALGWPVVLTVHDEVILVVPSKSGEKALADAIRLLSTPPTWAADCPLAAEGMVAERYGKG